MTELISLEERRQANADVILNFPRIDGDVELDKILSHARRYGRCLFSVAGSEVMQYCPVEGEVTIGENNEN